MKLYVRGSFGTSYDSSRSAKKLYVSKCVVESPRMPEEDVNDYPEKWTTFREDMRDYKTWCFVDAVEDGIFDESEWDLFNEYWEDVETSLAQPYA